MRRSDVAMYVGLAVMAGLSGTASGLAGQAHEHPSCPHRANDAHAAGVDHRHDETTGMAAETSVHHFEITSRGGVIRLEAADATDESGRDQAAIAVNDLRTFRHASRMDATLCLADHAVSDQQVAGKIEIARGIDDPGVCEKDRAAV